MPGSGQLLSPRTTSGDDAITVAILWDAPPATDPERTVRTPVRLPAPAISVRHRSPVQPGLASIVIAFPVVLGLYVWAWQFHQQVGVIGWITTVLWTLPFTSAVIGWTGGLLTVRRLRAARSLGPARLVHEPLLVVVPTIGRWDVLPALERVVHSYCEHLPRYFSRLRIDVVIEEGCAAQDAILALGRSSALVRIVIVPKRYQTQAGTRFKARANHYVHELRIAEGEARDDVWVLHMDDDTGVGPDTAEELARFVETQRRHGADAKHLAQGVLTYPREHGAKRLVWMADAVRPASDITTFALTTGRGTPRAGLHGELLVVRASIEATIGWDFGPRAMVEDAQFALYFTARYPGRSDWFAGRSLGATPASVSDFVKQRERWAWGLLELAANRTIPLRQRLLLIHNMITWACEPFQHIGVILLAGALLGDLDTLPATAAVLPLWAFNVAYQVWSHWEGLKINARASADARRTWWEPLAVVVLMPLFTVWESAGILRGFIKFVRGGDIAFTVIAKPL